MEIPGPKPGYRETGQGLCPGWFAEVVADHPNRYYYIMYESHIDSHTIAMLVVAFRSTALAVEHEAPVREAPGA